jgi:hypothetical protein
MEVTIQLKVQLSKAYWERTRWDDELGYQRNYFWVTAKPEITRPNMPASAESFFIGDIGYSRERHGYPWRVRCGGEFRDFGEYDDAENWLYASCGIKATEKDRVDGSKPQPEEGEEPPREYDPAQTAELLALLRYTHGSKTIGGIAQTMATVLQSGQFPDADWTCNEVRDYIRLIQIEILLLKEQYPVISQSGKANFNKITTD